MAGIWLCAQCHSANRNRSNSCYKCRTARSSGEMQEASAAFATVSAQQATANLAAAARHGARYRPSWIFALPTVALWSAGPWLQWRLLTIISPVVGPDGAIHLANSQFASFRLLALLYAGVLIGGAVVWGLWMAMLVGNVPALTARWTPHTPVGAFVSPWIPILSFKRPYTVVRNSLRILTSGQAGPGLIALLWWLASLAAWFGPVGVQIYAALSGRFDGRWAFIAASQVALAFGVLTSMLGIAVVVLVELQQRRLARARAAVVMLAEQPAGAG
jgi:hypothetical protein